MYKVVVVDIEADESTHKAAEMIEEGYRQVVKKFPKEVLDYNIPDIEEHTSTVIQWPNGRITIQHTIVAFVDFDEDSLTTDDEDDITGDDEP